MSRLDLNREYRVIGIEFTLVNQQGYREEIEMFVPKDERWNIPIEGNGYFPSTLQVTVHTSFGDVQAQIRMPR